MRDSWARWSVAALVVITALSLVIGFVWLPSAHADFTVKGIWDGICRAAGVPANWGSGESARTGARTTAVVLAPAMAKAGSAERIARELGAAGLERLSA